MTDETSLIDQRLAPEDVRSRKFGQVRRGGIDADEVYGFLAETAGEMAALQRERDWLEGEVARLRQQTGPMTPDRVEIQAVGILARAQQNADQVVADAQGLARSLADDGRRRREEIVADGHRRAQDLMGRTLDEATREAARIASEAPLNAQRQFTYYQALADAIRTQLHASLEALAASVRQWESEERDQVSAHLPAPAPPPAPME